MNYRLATIWPRKQYTADATEIIDVDIKDVISRIVVTAEPDNNPTGANANAHPVRCITKIELVDGSDVLFSLNGAEAQGVDFYDNGKVPPNIMHYLNGNYSEMIINMNLGRWLFDEEIALDPSRFSNLQLKVSIDIDGGGDEANDVYLTILAHIFDERVPKPLGFLTTKEQKQYTLANSTHEYTDLPTDYLYRQIFLRAQRYGYGPESQIDTVKISEDSDKRRPLDHTMYQILRNIVQDWPAYEEHILEHSLTVAQYFYNTPCYKPRFTATQWRPTDETASYAIYSGYGGRHTQDCEDANRNCQLFCRGHAPHAVVPLLPKFMTDYRMWYDPTKIGNLKLDVKGGSSVGTSQTCEIITQQLRKY